MRGMVATPQAFRNALESRPCNLARKFVLSATTLDAALCRCVCIGAIMGCAAHDRSCDVLSFSNNCSVSPTSGGPYA